MQFATLALIALPFVAGVLGADTRHKSKQHIPHRSHKTPQRSPKTPSSYTGPGQYYIDNQATDTTMDLFEGDAGPDTEITGYLRTVENEHQIWNIVAAARYHQVAIINSATGAIASCSTEANDDGLLQLKGGEVALNGKSLFTLSINKDKSAIFKNVADPDLCIDLQGSSAEDETPIICYSCTGGKNQNWYLVPVTGKKPDDDEL